MLAMDASHELLDHTADVGMRSWAGTMSELVSPAGDAPYAALGEFVTIGDYRAFDFERMCDNVSIQLRDYLGEILILLERDGRVATSVESVTFGDDRLVACATTAAVDGARTVCDREVLAITYNPHLQD